MSAARARSGPRLTRVLEAAGVPRPRALVLRVFKEERLLEMWAAAAAEGPFVHLGDHAVCASSGGPGPKARVGDGHLDASHRLPRVRAGSDGTYLVE